MYLPKRQTHLEFASFNVYFIDFFFFPVLGNECISGPGAMAPGPLDDQSKPKVKGSLMRVFMWFVPGTGPSSPR
jgi:hypothetical protein